MRKLVLFGILISMTTSLFRVSEETGMEPYCYRIYFNNKLACQNFTSFRQLNFQLAGDEVYSGVLFEPQKTLRLRLDSELNLEGLKLAPDSATLEFRNIFDIDFFYNPFLVLSNLWLDIRLIESQWQFSNLPSTLAFDPSEVYFMSDLNISLFILDNCNIASPIHAAMFKGSRIKEWVYQTIDSIKYETESLDESALKIEVGQLEVRYTSLDSNMISSTTLLNERIFSKIKSLEIIATQVDRVDELSILKLEHLRSLKLIYVSLDNILKNGLDWMRSLNPGFNLDTAVIAGNLTLSDAFKFQITVENLPTRDEDICLFKDYPHSQFVIPLLLHSSFESLQNILPCTCLIYWLYRDYPIYSYLFSNMSAVSDTDFIRYIPFHCLNINSILYDEQIDYCQSRFQNQCDGSTSSNSSDRTSRLDVSTMTAVPPIPTCFDTVDSSSVYCRCSFEGRVNYLECSNSSMNQLPDSFSSQFDWDFVTFVGSPIYILRTNSFKQLRLRPNATLVVSNVIELGTDLFSSSMVFDGLFRFVVKNSSMLTLAASFPFRGMNFSELVFQNDNFDVVSIGAFDGTFVDRMIIDGADPKSMSPFFRRYLVRRVPQIRQLKISNVRDIFSNNSPIRKFVLDDLLLSPVLFSELEELEIINTRVDYIISNSMSQLTNLRVVKLENVNLRSIINHYFDEELPAIVDEYQIIEFNEPRVNWLSMRTLERVYFGREGKAFEFKDEDLCFFAGMSPNTTVYLYDNIDSPSGVRCTCTIYWIYRYIEFDRIGVDLDPAYIPKCIQQLNNTENLLIKLVECLNGRNPTEYCKYLPESQTTASETTVTTAVTTTATTKQTTQDLISSTSTAPLSTTSSQLFSNDPRTSGISLTEPMSSQSTTWLTSKQESTNRDDFDRISTMLLVLLIEFPVLSVLNLAGIALIVYVLLKKRSAAATARLKPADVTVLANSARNVNLENGNPSYAPFSSTYL